MKNFIDLSKPEEREVYDFLSSWILKQRTPSYHTYVIVVRDEEGKLSTHERISRPCYGELRRYREKSNNRKDDRFPGDLLNNFPEGTPTALAFYFPDNIPSKKEISLYREKYWSSYNPWIGNIPEIVDNIEFIRNEKGYIRGFILNCGDFPPTNLVATLMNHRSRNKDSYDVFQWFVSDGLEEEIALPLSIVVNKNGDNFIVNNPINVSSESSKKRFWNKDTIDLDGGLLWSEGADYNRPEVMHLFREEGSIGFPYQIIPKENVKNIYKSIVYDIEN